MIYQITINYKLKIHKKDQFYKIDWMEIYQTGKMTNNLNFIICRMEINSKLVNMKQLKLMNLKMLN